MRKIFNAGIAVLTALSLTLPAFAEEMSSSAAASESSSSVSSPAATSSSAGKKQMQMEEKMQKFEEKQMQKEEKKMHKEERKQQNQADRAAAIICIGAAVDVREAAIATAWDTLSASGKTALQTRRDALKAAYAQADPAKVRQAVQAAWQAFALAHKSARIAFKEARMKLWMDFKTARKACKPGKDVVNELKNISVEVQ